MKPEEFHFTPMIKFQVKVPKGFTYILFEPIKFHESIEWATQGQINISFQ